MFSARCHSVKAKSTNYFANKLRESLAFWCSGILIISIAVSRTGLISRFPWEDMYWNDLQIYNSWRWFNETLRESSLFFTLHSVIDFRQNTGDLFVASTKWANPLLDIGAWFSFITGNYSLAFSLKFIVLSSLGGIGLYKLISNNPYFGGSRSKYKILVFSALLASMVFHPLLNGEVGPLNQWYLLLIPNWFLILSTNRLGKSSSPGFLSINLVFLTVLSLGSSDLFFISTITALYLLFFLKSLTQHVAYAIFVKQYLFVLALFLIDKSWLIFGRIREYGQFSSKGSWEPGYYFSEFIYPLFRNTILIPRFEGPASLFINFFLLALLVRAWQCRKNSEFLRITLILFAVALMLLLSGFIAHSIPVIRDSLPSAVRYHLTFVSFGIISILAGFSNFSLEKIKKGSPSSKSNIGFYFVSICISILILFLNISNYGGMVPPTSRYLLSTETNNWYTSVLPKCIDTNIGSSDFSSAPRSFIFSKKLGTDNYMDDSLLILSELPDKLSGRTFQQWRYSVGKLNANLLGEAGASGLFTRPFLPDNISGIKLFSERSMSPFILSTERLSSTDFDFLGLCKFPQNLSNVVGQNPTLGSDIYLYHAKYFADSQLLNTQYRSSNSSFLFMCPKQKWTGTADLNLPINYHESIRATINGDKISASPGDLNQVVLKLGEKCSAEKVLRIQISSYSTFNLIRMFTLFFLVILLPCFMLFRPKVRHKPIN